MNHVFGTMTLGVSVAVETQSEELALLQANYKVNPDRFIGYELFGINSKGEREIINVNSCETTLLDEFVEA